LEFNKWTVELEKKDDDLHLRPIGDIHAGNLAFDKTEFEKTMKEIAKDSHVFTLMMGDAIDNIQAWANGGVDKRWNAETVERDRLTTEEQIDYFVEWWAKVAHKSGGMHSGNHEWKTINQRRFIKDFCHPQDPKSLDKVLYNQKYLGRLALTNLTIKYKKKTLREFVILSHHGGFAGMRQGGTLNRLEDITSSFEGVDVSLMGHTHRTWVATAMIQGYDKFRNSMYERKIILGNTGTFLRSYVKGVDSYMESSPRRSTRVGTITITFNAESGKKFAHD
tara:strand:+ start:560 stop:1393 length:834 start_codon:yes stop_codon:yes gene_type:complete